MPKLKSHELRHYLGAGVARNAGPSRQQRNAPRMDAARADKVTLADRKEGTDAGEIGKPWDEHFRKGNDD